jgi:hypothetical protein
VNKSDIEKQMHGIVSDRFIELWWNLELPGLGKRTPQQVYDEDPGRLLEYVKTYSEVD